MSQNMLEWSPQVLHDSPLKLAGGSIQVRGEWLLTKITARLAILAKAFTEVSVPTPLEQVRALFHEHKLTDKNVYTGQRQSIKIAGQDMLIPSTDKEEIFISEWGTNEAQVRLGLLWEIMQVIQAKQFAKLAATAFVGLSLADYSYLMKDVESEQAQIRAEWAALFEKPTP